MQIEVNAEGFKVRIRLGDTWSRWYNGTEFAGVRNLVRSAEQTKFWIEQELRRANSLKSAYDNAKHDLENNMKDYKQPPLSEDEKQYDIAKRAKEFEAEKQYILAMKAQVVKHFSDCPMQELKKELGKR